MLSTNVKFSFGKWFVKIVSHIPNSWGEIHNEALLFLELSKELIDFVVEGDVLISRRGAVAGEQYEARYSG